MTTLGYGEGEKEKSATALACHPIDNHADRIDRRDISFPFPAKGFFPRSIENSLTLLIMQREHDYIAQFRFSNFNVILQFYITYVSYYGIIFAYEFMRRLRFPIIVVPKNTINAKAAAVFLAIWRHDNR